MNKIPKRYENVRYEDVPNNIRSLFEKMRETRKGIFIYGGVGTGKTHIAYALAKNSKDRINVNSIFWNTTELLREMRLDINRQTVDKNRYEEKLFESRDLVFLDDIGAEKLTDWVSETFYLIVNKRYNEMLPIIFTSNFSPSELSERIGDRTVSRIVGMCDVIKIDGADKRI